MEEGASFVICLPEWEPFANFFTQDCLFIICTKAAIVIPRDVQYPTVRKYSIYGSYYHENCIRQDS